MLVFLAITPSICLSVEIRMENHAFPKSKLILMEIGIIEDNNSTYRKKIRYHLPANPFSVIKIAEITIIMTKRYLESLLTSWSKIPNLDLGFLEFKATRVCFPAYNTSPKHFPAVITVFAHNVCSNDNGSEPYSESTTPIKS